jgi:hypothetical protein
MENIVIFMTICNIVRPFGIFGIVCGHWVYFPVLVCFDRENSGNPEADAGRFWQQKRDKILK